MGKHRQAVAKRGESKTISSTSEERQREEKGDRHSLTGAARKSRKIFTVSRSRTAAENSHVAEAS